MPAFPLHLPGIFMSTLAHRSSLSFPLCDSAPPPPRRRHDPSESLCELEGSRVLVVMPPGVLGREDSQVLPGGGRSSRCAGLHRWMCLLLARAQGQGCHGPRRITGSKAAIKGKWGPLRKLEGKASWVSGNPIMNL